MPPKKLLRKGGGKLLEHLELAALQDYIQQYEGHSYTSTRTHIYKYEDTDIDLEELMLVLLQLLALLD